MSAPHASETNSKISITPLLKRLYDQSPVTALDISSALALTFTNELSPVQTAALLTVLRFHGYDRRAEVLAKCAEIMREAAQKVDVEELRDVVRRKGRAEGGYRGGLCDIVGTGGDSHSTFNVSTAASILASSLLLVAKHGSRASTSKSGSADVLEHMQPQPPRLENVSAQRLASIYERTNYAFLFAHVFHPGMRFVAPVRKELGWRTIFNTLGPLANPVESSIEARIMGVASQDMGAVFAEALVLGGASKAMVVCGLENLDEISCAGPTSCWRIVDNQKAESGAEEDESSGDETMSSADVAIEHFTLTPEDFGLPRHPLSAVGPGNGPHENAAILTRLLNNEMSPDDPILHFVLLNAAALFVISGLCDADSSNVGDGDDGQVIAEKGPGGGRWKEGVRRSRWALRSGKAWKMWQGFVEATNSSR